jgi:hypothetical protein
MTKDEVKALARYCGVMEDECGLKVRWDDFERFAHVLIAGERDACARIAESAVRAIRERSVEPPNH